MIIHAAHRHLSVQHSDYLSINRCRYWCRCSYPADTDIDTRLFCFRYDIIVLPVFFHFLPYIIFLHQLPEQSQLCFRKVYFATLADSHQYFGCRQRLTNLPFLRNTEIMEEQLFQQRSLFEYPVIPVQKYLLFRGKPIAFPLPQGTDRLGIQGRTLQCFSFL